jgi:hypothetical protein
MRLMRLVSSASVAGMMSLALVGSAAADDVNLDSTGSNSDNTVTIDNTNTVTTTNTNDVQVVNLNVQQATTGDVTANKNTNVDGDLSSGAASNSNNTVTDVTIENTPSVSAGGGQGGGGGGSQNNNGGGSTSTGGGKGGGVLGAATGGLGAGAILPVTGPSSPVDVSALRAAWHPNQSSNTAAENLVKRTRAISTAMLVTAALLSLMGAVLSAVYARRKEGRV